MTLVLVVISWIWHQKPKQQKQVGLLQTKKLLHSKENNQQSEEATNGMGENICNSYIW